MDINDHLPTNELLTKVLEYSVNNIPIAGIIDPIKNVKSIELIGIEIGVCCGVSTEFLCKNLANLKILFAVDNYPTYIDWDGTKLTDERQKVIKEHAQQRLAKYSNIKLIYEKSSKFSETLPNNLVDFIFIDGDHSYNSIINDLNNYWPKVKSGGVFAGHGVNLPSVNCAIYDFFGKDLVAKIIVTVNNGWYIIKS